LSDVFVRRKGIPLSLSLVFIGLCRSVGLKAVGIGFPGHFLVRIIPEHELVKTRAAAGKENAQDWKEQHFVDCFEGGSFLTVQDCEKRLSDWTRGVLPFGPDALKVAHPQEILSRMLRNLRAIFTEKEDYARLYWVLTALIELCPLERTEALKDRGFLLARMSRFNQATQDLKAYMQVCSDPAKLSHVEKMIRFFSDQSDLMN
jgi:regulator of sirC expression with transglutaminase-like and TPR domain